MSVYKNLGPISFYFQSNAAEVFLTSQFYLIQLKGQKSNSTSSLQVLQFLQEKYNSYLSEELFLLYSEPNKPGCLLLERKHGQFIQKMKDFKCSKNMQIFCQLTTLLIESLQNTSPFIEGEQEIYLQNSMFFFFKQKKTHFYIHIPNISSFSQSGSNNLARKQKLGIQCIIQFLDSVADEIGLSNKVLVKKLKKCQRFAEVKDQIAYFQKVYQIGYQNSPNLLFNQKIDSALECEGRKKRYQINLNRLSHRKEANNKDQAGPCDSFFESTLKHSTSQHLKKEKMQQYSALRSSYSKLSRSRNNMRSFHLNKSSLFQNREKTSKGLHSSLNQFYSSQRTTFKTPGKSVQTNKYLKFGQNCNRTMERGRKYIDNFVESKSKERNGQEKINKDEQEGLQMTINENLKKWRQKRKGENRGKDLANRGQLKKSNKLLVRKEQDKWLKLSDNNEEFDLTNEQTIRKPTNYYEMGEGKLKENKNNKISPQLNLTVESQSKEKKEIEIQTQMQEELTLNQLQGNQWQKQKQRQRANESGRIRHAHKRKSIQNLASKQNLKEKQIRTQKNAQFLKPNKSINRQVNSDSSEPNGQSQVMDKARTQLETINCIALCVINTPNVMSSKSGADKYLWQLPAFIFYKQFHIRKLKILEGLQQKANRKGEKPRLGKLIREVEEQNQQTQQSLIKLLRAALKKLKKYNIDEEVVEQTKQFLNMDLSGAWSKHQDEIILSYISELEQIREEKQDILEYELDVIDSFLIIKGMEFNHEERKMAIAESGSLKEYFRKRIGLLKKFQKK